MDKGKGLVKNEKFIKILAWIFKPRRTSSKGAFTNCKLLINLIINMRIVCLIKHYFATLKYFCRQFFSKNKKFSCTKIYSKIILPSISQSRSNSHP